MGAEEKIDQGKNKLTGSKREISNVVFRSPRE
jgi:hypothetical protein